MSKKERNNNRDDKTTPQQKVDGIFSGLSEILVRLNDLAEKAGDQFSHVEDLTSKEGKQIKGVMGYNVKIGLAGDKGEKKDFSVEPLDTGAKDQNTATATVKEVLEPIVDIFEESDHTLVIAELPGIGSEDVTIDVKGDILTIAAEKNVKKYYKELLLPQSYTADQVRIAGCNNGIVEIICTN